MLGVKLTILWTDARLNVTDCKGYIPSSLVKDMWLPRPYMLSTSYIELIKTTVATEYHAFEPPNLFVWYQELNIGVQCPFDFSYYPFDSHSCKVQFHSASYTDKVVHYSSRLKDSSHHLQHAVKYDVAYREFSDEKDFYMAYSNDSSISYSACGFYIDLNRKRGPSIINIFIPSFLIVLIAFCRYCLIMFSLVVIRLGQTPFILELAPFFASLQKCSSALLRQSAPKKGVA